MQNLKYYLQNNRQEILDYLVEKHEGLYIADNKNIPDNEFSIGYERAYNATINELLELTPAEKQSTILVQFVEADSFNNEPWIDVVIKNPDYQKDPPENKKWWGGKEDDEFDCPEGCYNVNWRGYQKVFGISGINRAEMLENIIEVEDRVFSLLKSESAIVGEILFDLTFYGFLQKDSEKFWDDIKKDDDDGEYITWEELKEKLK